MVQAIRVDSLDEDRNTVKKICQIEGDNKRVLIGALPHLKCDGLLVYQSLLQFHQEKNFKVESDALVEVKRVQ